MIVEAIVSVLAGLVSFVGGLMPEIAVPGFVGSLVGLVGTITGYMAPLGYWIPFGPAGTATGFVLVALAVSLVVRLVRVIASFLTGGGGGAA